MREKFIKTIVNSNLPKYNACLLFGYNEFLQTTLIFTDILKLLFLVTQLLLDLAKFSLEPSQILAHMDNYSFDLAL
jgi:hypothetical protein